MGTTSIKYRDRTNGKRGMKRDRKGEDIEKVSLVLHQGLDVDVKLTRVSLYPEPLCFLKRSHRDNSFGSEPSSK